MPRKVLLATTRRAAEGLMCPYDLVAARAAQVAHDLAAIPESEVLDTVLRAEAAIDRGLSRAMDRRDLSISDVLDRGGARLEYGFPFQGPGLRPIGEHQLL